MGTDRSVHAAREDYMLSGRILAPWDRVVSPHAFAILGLVQAACAILAAALYAVVFDAAGPYYAAHFEEAGTGADADYFG
jgi:hypothetical protein